MLEKIKKLKVHISWKSLILVGVLVALVLIDLLTKIFEERDGWNFIVIPNFIWVVSGARNPGCAFSFLENASWGQPFLITVTFLMLIVLIALFVLLPERFLVIKTSIAVIIAGAIGNLIDRIAFFEVRDFVNINMLFTSASCNFADFWIVIGTIIAVIDILFLDEFAVFPLTKRAKQAQRMKKEEQSAAPEIEGRNAEEQAQQSEVVERNPEDDGE